MSTPASAEAVLRVRWYDDRGQIHTSALPAQIPPGVTPWLYLPASARPAPAVRAVHLTDADGRHSKVWWGAAVRFDASGKLLLPTMQRAYTLITVEWEPLATP